jgi:enoyl-CoA hydratase/carnithine racemase
VSPRAKPTSPDALAVVEVRDAFATVTLNRPDVLNAMSPEMLTAIDDAMAYLEGRHGVRTVVFRGAGRAFSAGGDLARMVEWDAETAASTMAWSHAVRSRVEALTCPTIAAVHGYAMGGGLELAMCCDFIVLTESAKVGLPEVKVGMIPSSGGTTRLPYLVGTLVAKRMIMTGRSLPADEALRIGLATMVVADDALEASYLELVDQLRGVSPTALAQAKRIMNGTRGIPFEDAQRFEREAALVNFDSAHRREGNRAFLEKRDPTWQD